MLPRYTIFDTPILRSIMPPLARCALRLAGWRMEGEIPNIRKAVFIAAPHTSNWDFPVMMAFVFAYRVRVHWLGKDALFRGPGYWLFRWLGGIPVDRSRTGGLVAQSAQAFQMQNDLLLAIPPEGTRSRASGWRTGFYHIAQTAQVPIVMSYVDFSRKVGGVGELLIPSGDIDSDMQLFRAFYADVRGKYPALETEVRVAKRS